MINTMIKCSIATKKTVILFHGWTGGKENVMELALELKEKSRVNVFIPSLTGHGKETSKKLFLKATSHDWLNDAEKAYEYCVKESLEVIAVGGISMGSLLAIHTANKYKITSLMLVSPALFNKNKLIYLTPIASFFLDAIKLKTPREFRPWSYYEDEDYLEVQKEVFKKYVWIKPAAELLKLQIKARKTLKALDINRLWVVMSEQDETCPLKQNISFIRKHTSPKISKNIKIMTAGNHEILNDIRVEKEVCDFITNSF